MRKKQAYLKFLQMPTEENRNIYKEKRNVAKAKIREAHEKSWNRFINVVEEDTFGRQTLAFKVMKSLNAEE